MDIVRQTIRDRIHYKRGDNIPFTPWEGVDFSRGDLAQLMGDMGFKVGAEIGVRKGEFSRVLCQRIPNLTLHCVDIWAPYRKGVHPSQERADGWLEATKRNLEGFNYHIVRKPSVDAAKDFPDGSLDFVYIDAMHEFDFVMQDIIVWTPKVRRHGIVSGHDYFFGYGVGVVNAVDAYVRAHGIGDFYLTSNVKNDKTVSWFWVR